MIVSITNLLAPSYGLPVIAVLHLPMPAFKCLNCGDLAEEAMVIRPADNEETCEKCGRASGKEMGKSNR
jgi:hypothetical protein